MSPTDIRLSAIKAGKLTLERIAELIEARTSFAFETTLSGRGHLKLLADAKRRHVRDVRPDCGLQPRLAAKRATCRRKK